MYVQYIATNTNNYRVQFPPPVLMYTMYLEVPALGSAELLQVEVEH